MDEARLGLKPIERRGWFPVGHRAIQKVNPRYEWDYVYSAVEPATGRTFSLIMPEVNKIVWRIWLEKFAEQLVPGERNILVMDNAPWHQFNDDLAPEGIIPLALPPYSPELNPSERLWPKLRDVLSAKVVASKDELRDYLSAEILRWIATPAELQSLTYYYWIKDALEPNSK
jgi:transposase